MQRIEREKKCAHFRPTGKGEDRLPSTHLSTAGELPNWTMRNFILISIEGSSMRSLASTAHIHTGYIKSL
jgi:hypothetical protein